MTIQCKMYSLAMKLTHAVPRIPRSSGKIMSGKRTDEVLVYCHIVDVRLRPIGNGGRNSFAWGRTRAPGGSHRPAGSRRRLSARAARRLQIAAGRRVDRVGLARDRAATRAAGRARPTA